MITSLVVGDGLLTLKRNREPKCIECKEKVLLDGGKYYCNILSDGTVMTGRYDAQGRHYTVSPDLINDVFDFGEQDRLWSGSIMVNRKKCFLLKRVYNEWYEKYSFDSVPHDGFFDVLAPDKEDDDW